MRYTLSLLTFALLTFAAPTKAASIDIKMYRLDCGHITLNDKQSCRIGGYTKGNHMTSWCLAI
jgi:hypothetical protein